MSERPIQLPRAAAHMVAAALILAIMSLAVRVASSELPNTMVVFFRNALGLVVLLAWVKGARRVGLRTRRIRDHILRGVFGLSAMYCFFYSVAHMPLAVAISLNYSMPLFLPMIERAWIKEPIPRGMWTGLAVGFAGVLLILKPGTQLFQPLALVAVGAAIFAALAQVAIRRLTTTEPPARIVFYFGLVATLVSSAPLSVDWRTPTPHIWIVLLSIGVMATVAQLAMTQAFALAPAARVGPFIYAAVPAAAALDLVVLRRLPDLLSLLGAALVVCAAAITLRRLR